MTFKYRIGQENDIVKEQDFNNSIFRDQYLRALGLIDGYLDEEESQENTDSLKIVGFCGDRGDGKTSCMYNVRRILEDVQKPDNYSPSTTNHAKRFVNNSGMKNLVKTKFFCLDIIDPSYFDNSHNILEILIGKLYSEYSKIAENKKHISNRIEIQGLLKLFENVKRGIFNLHKKEESVYSELTEIRMLSSAVELKDQLRCLIKAFLKFSSTSRLVIPIDDIDLNVNGAFEMCEQIRKYLSIPECILLIAVKPEQLTDVVASQFYEEMGKYPSFGQKDYFLGMAQRYIAKLLPVSTRITMRSAYDFCDGRLEIYKISNIIIPFGAKPYYENNHLKDGIVNLIFKKTRYLFYNLKGGVSPIIPYNLRQLNALLGLLCRMKDVSSGDEDYIDLLRRNGNAFKNYFFNVWTDYLPVEYKEEILRWVNETANNALNKRIVEWLASNFKEELDRRYQIFDSWEDYSLSSVKYNNILRRITDNRNFSYNVTVGDLFFILGLLELDTLSAAKRRMLFFIKSYYSIRLFEEYDIETYLLDHHEDQPGSSESETERIKSDTVNSDSSQVNETEIVFTKSNWLQRIVGGSFFTFFPGELLPNDSSGLHHFDTRVINGSIRPTFEAEKDMCYTLRDLILKCSSIIRKYDEYKKNYESLKKSEIPNEIKESIRIKEKLRIWELNFKTAEFFILTVSRSIKRNDVASFYNAQDSFRSVSVPAYLIEFNRNSGYYVFDALAPFSNLLNPRFCYERYEDITKELFEFALKHKFSLLSQMISQTTSVREHINGDTEGKEIHRLMSDAVIRNGEVLNAMRAKIQSDKDLKNRIEGISKLLKLYNSISESGMSTHYYDENEKHEIRFSFLKPLQQFILEILKLEEEDAARKTFYYIFDSAEETLLTKPNNDNKLRDKLESQLLLLLGSDKTWTSKDILKRLQTEYPNEVGDITHTMLLKATEGKNYIKYDVPMILDLLFRPQEKPRLDIWTKILGLESDD